MLPLIGLNVKTKGCVKFLYKTGGNVTLLTQSVTFTSQCCSRTNSRHVYVCKRFTPIFFATQKKQNVSFRARISGICPAYFSYRSAPYFFVLFVCISYTFDTKCNLWFSVLNVPKRPPHLCLSAVYTPLGRFSKKKKCDTFAIDVWSGELQTVPRSSEKCFGSLLCYTIFINYSIITGC